MESKKYNELIAQVEAIELRTKRTMTEQLTGNYRSTFKGSGLNFSEVREYFAGDDIRSIDWNVTARTGSPHVKKFTEEREGSIFLLVDISGSSLFGSGSTSKRQKAAELAALLAFSAMKNRDKVGLILFSQQIELYLPPKKGRAHILRIIREVLFYQVTERKTSLSTPLRFLIQIWKKSCIAFFISDFSISSGRDYHKLLPLLKAANNRYDLIACQIIEPQEIQLPNLGWIRLEDAESGEQLEINSSDPGIRKRYQQAIYNQQQKLNRALHSCGIDRIEISTQQELLPRLLHFFSKRREHKKQ